jgi:hypothetical protein
VAEDDKAYLFQKGRSGNPAGRPRGARSRLGTAFVEAMLKDFGEFGEVVIATVRAEKPDQYLKVIASILPKEITGEDGEALQLVTRIELVGVRPNADSPA